MEQLATDTITIFSFGLLKPRISIQLLATLEVGLGVLLSLTKELKFTFILLIFHMAFTTLLSFILTNVMFKSFPFQLTIEGQYIIKNFVIIAAAFVLLYAQMVTSPD